MNQNVPQPQDDVAKKSSPPGSRTQLSRVTGECTIRYTSEDLKECLKLYLLTRCSTTMDFSLILQLPVSTHISPSSLILQLNMVAHVQLISSLVYLFY